MSPAQQKALEFTTQLARKYPILLEQNPDFGNLLMIGYLTGFEDGSSEKYKEPHDTSHEF